MEASIPGRGPGGGADPRHLVLRERLGEGSYGVVYRAEDPRSGANVAVKVLRQSRPGAIARFKREFRALADIHHDNLVSLYRLSADGGRWAFSMEWVDGVDLLQWVTFGRRAWDDDPNAAPADPPGERHARLRSVVRQVGEGLAVLHRAGHLHRDLKPSNVLVTREGRAVLLDFGLVDDLHPAMHRRLADPAGSPAYMSPEQSAGAPATEASDWYSLGVSLFEALTGRLPFEGTSRALLVRKQTEDPPDVRTFAADVPEDLASLCNDLLARPAGLRPRADEAMARLAARSAPAPAVMPEPGATLEGREAEMAMLEEGLRSVRTRGEPVLVELVGEPGMGKTALLQRFAARAARQRAVVLSGRCYEQETMPYKGLDGVVDALAQYLQTLSNDELERILPADTELLARMFPVLAQVPRIAEPAEPSITRDDPVDPHGLREAAFSQLAELLRRLARRRPVIVAIDDAHFGDRDSAALLRSLLESRPALPIQWVLARHPDTSATPPMVGALEASRPGDVRATRIVLGPLGDDEARAVVRAGLGPTPLSEDRLDALVRESGGVPLFLAQLTEQALLTGWAEGVSLAEVVAERLVKLGSETRGYLEAVALFGRPVAADWAARAAGTPATEAAAVTALRAARLLRVVSGVGDTVLVEPYHDRTRDLVVGTLAPDRRRRMHEAWVAVLENHAAVHSEDLAHHLEGAGRTGEAAQALARGAERAVRALAWDRAARLYARALDLTNAPRDDADRWRFGLAQALANAGRSTEAATVYRALAEAAGDERRVGLMREAAEQLLRSGRMDEGFGALREVLASCGLTLPQSPAHALVALARARGHLRLRGTRFRERPAGLIPPEELRRVDVCLSAAMGLGGVDSLRAAFFQSQGLRLALEVGEPRRIARALVFEAAFQSNRGERGHGRARRLIDTAHRLVDRLEDPYLDALEHSAQAVAAFHVGRWQRCVELSERAESLYAGRRLGTGKETMTVRLFGLAALTQLGHFEQVHASCRAWLADAERRGDVYASVNLRTGLPLLAWLARDEPTEAQRLAEAAMADWRSELFLVPRVFDVLARAEADLYRGRASLALARLEATRPAIRASLLSRLQVLRVLLRDLWGRASLTLHHQGIRGNHLGRAAKMARALGREGVPWAEALGERLRGGVALARGREAEALRHWSRAADRFTDADMRAHAATARFALEEHVTVGSGSAVETMRELGIRRPERFARLHFPALRSRPAAPPELSSRVRAGTSRRAG